MAARSNRSPHEAPRESVPAAPAIPASRLVVAGRVILLVFAAAAAVSGFVLGGRDVQTGSSSRLRYVCPMHPEATAAAPGGCPICGMALSEIRAAPAAPPWREESAPRQQSAVDAARRRTFSLEVRASAWLERQGVVRALLYADEIAALESGEHGVFIPASSGTRASVRLAQAPATPADGSTSWVEFQLQSGDPALSAGTAGWVELAARPRAVLVIPSTAILQSPSGPYVYASRDGRTFARRSVTIGRTVFGLATVVEGLQEQERVATRSAFFLDAEERLSTGAAAMSVKR